MLKERFRLMYMPANGTDIKQMSLDWKNFYFYLSLFTISSILFGALLVGSVTSLYQNFRIVGLKNDRERLQKELLAIKGKVADLSDRLALVEDTGNELRNVAALDAIDSDIRQVGVGGSSFEYRYYLDDMGRTTGEINLDLEKIERAINLERTSLDEITVTLKDREDRIDHFPSIIPILDGRITSRFRFRVDPLTGKLTDHKGVDIPMPEGTNVLCTADGRVEIVKTLFKPNKSYGQCVVIDHGYGYRTLYAHLSKIHVRQGQQVKRWEIIGEVGETGRATGPHLHYEVIANNKRVDPESFIL
jgi:murein DD-endopeptidase MepM/ murein hydrolase activator NlpD